MLLLTLP
jgi:hypothetical protein